jgi:hypothetical protein
MSHTLIGDILSQLINPLSLSRISPLLIKDLILEPLQLLLFGFYCLKIPQDILPHLIVITLHLLHLGRHPRDHLRFSFPQLLQFCLITYLQLLFIIPHPDPRLLLLIQAHLRYLKLPNPLNLLLQLLLIPLVEVILVFQEALL